MCRSQTLRSLRGMRLEKSRSLDCLIQFAKLRLLSRERRDFFFLNANSIACTVVVFTSPSALHTLGSLASITPPIKQTVKITFLSIVNQSHEFGQCSAHRFWLFYRLAQLYVRLTASAPCTSMAAAAPPLSKLRLPLCMKG